MSLRMLLWQTLSEESNIIPGIMLEDKLVEILGARFPCVDTGFAEINRWTW